MDIYGTPGIKSARETGDFPIKIQNPEYLAGGVLIDGSNSRDFGNTGDTDVLRPGMLMRRVSNQYRPAILGSVSSDYTTGTTLTVGTATAQMVEKVIGSSGTLWVLGHDGSGTAEGDVDAEEVTFSAVDTGAGTLTITALTGDFDAGSVLLAFQPALLGGSGGVSGHAEAFILINKADGVKVTDPDDADMDAMLAEAAIGGVVDASQIIDWDSTLTGVPEVLAHNIRQTTRFMLDNLYRD